MNYDPDCSRQGTRRALPVSRIEPAEARATDDGDVHCCQRVQPETVHPSEVVFSLLCALCVVIVGARWCMDGALPPTIPTLLEHEYV